jgi:hypothetical protein
MTAGAGTNEAGCSASLLLTVIARRVHVIWTLLRVRAHPDGIKAHLLDIPHHLCGACPCATTVLICVLALPLQALL